MTTAPFRIACCAILFCTIAVDAAAQDRRWTIELLGGASVAAGGRTGDVTVPPPGPSIITNGPLSPSRAVPSWFFGDGAEILNAVLASFDQPSRLAPLETALADGASVSGGVMFGARVRRSLSERWAVEGGVTFEVSGASFDSGIVDAAEQTRASFIAAWTALFGTGPLANVDVSAVQSDVEGGARSAALTGAIVYTLPERGTWMPYLVGGGGIVTSAGSAAMTLEGRYAFDVAIAGAPPLGIDETDRVTLRLETRTVPVGVAGAGVRRRLNDRWTFVADARLLIGPNATSVRLDATPSSDSPGPAGFIEVPANPSIQFSSDPATGRVSTLSGDRLRDFDLFVGDGVQTRVQITIGASVRF